MAAQGHEVVAFYPPNLGEFARDYFNFALADLGKLSLQDWEGEVLDQAIEGNRIVHKVPFRRLVNQNF